MRRTLLVCLALVLGFAVTAAPSFAQGVQTATLTGSVTSADGEPLPGVTVTITSPSLIGERSTVTGVNGDYVFKNVPPGNYTVNFALEGMKTVERTATLPLGGTARSDASMEVTAAEETIVVTGEAGAARQREIGNAISSVKMQNLVEPPRDVQQLLGGRVAGAVITESTGSAGSGGFVRLRGINSVSMSNTPLLYIDGIRVRSEDLPRNYPRGDRSNRSGNVQASPLSIPGWCESSTAIPNQGRPSASSTSSQWTPASPRPTSSSQPAL